MQWNIEHPILLVELKGFCQKVSFFFSGSWIYPLLVFLLMLCVLLHSDHLLCLIYSPAWHEGQCVSLQNEKTFLTAVVALSVFVLSRSVDSWLRVKWKLLGETLFNPKFILKVFVPPKFILKMFVPPKCGLHSSRVWLFFVKSAVVWCYRLNDSTYCALLQLFQTTSYRHASLQNPAGRTLLTIGVFKWLHQSAGLCAGAFVTQVSSETSVFNKQLLW